MVWVKYKMAVKGHAVGETVEIEDGLAATLIENEIVEKCEAPAEVASAATELKGSLATFVKNSVQECFTELRKSLPSTRSGFVNPADEPVRTIPATAKKYCSLQNFKGTNADERAYRFGMFMLGAYGKKNPREWCAKQGIQFLEDIDGKASNENTNTSSGFLVPDEFQNDLIDLRETYGVFRRNAKIVPMASDTRSDPRRVNGVTAYFVGEDTAAAQSTKTWDRVRLTAKKLMVLTKYSNELNEDAVLNIGDDLAGEIAYSFALKEDQCGFIGDGSSTYGGITGAVTALKNVDATVANVKGLQVASGTGYASSYGSIVLADLNATLGRLPQYAYQSGNVKWYCSQYFWGTVMQKLATAAGGNVVSNIVNGVPEYRFLGFPVEISQIMPSSPAVNQVVCLFGNLRMAASLGDRRTTSIKMSEHALNAFEQDEIAIRGTERFDIVVHDVGDSTASPRSAQAGAVAGPIVGLITAAS